MIEHEFSPGNPRCLHCGTLYARHVLTPQPCVPRWSSREKLMPLPDKQREHAVYDVDTIHARIIELRVEEDAARNRPADE